MKILYKTFAGVFAALIAINAHAQLDAPINFPLPPNISAANVSAAEYYFDSDPGFGNGTNIPITAGNNVLVSNFSIAVNTLSTGVHHLYVRTKNINGVWGLSNESNFFIIPQDGLFPANTGAGNISAAEYFIDNDPGFGKGAPINIVPGSNVSVNNFAVGIDTLSVGVHRLYVRTQNINGVWSIANVASFYIVQGASYFPPNSSTANVAAAEYFVDTDPGFGNGISVSITSGSDVSANNIAVDISSLAQGVHRIYVRTKNANRQWSITNVASFYIVPVSFSIPPNPVTGNITALEYFFDTDPGFGNGTMISVSPTTDLSNYKITADISGLKQDTTHTLYVRALDGWSQTNSVTFAIGQALAVKWLSFTGSLQANNSVLLQWQTMAEQNNSYFEVQRSNNGITFTNIGKVIADTVSASKHYYSFTDNEPASENNFYRIQQVDKDGNYTYSSVLPVIVSNHSASDFYVINNPALNTLRVHTGGNENDAELRIFDINGRQLVNVPATANSVQEINISALTAGMYIIQYKSISKKVTQKFIKQ